VVGLGCIAPSRWMGLYAGRACYSAFRHSLHPRNTKRFACCPSIRSDTMARMNPSSSTSSSSDLGNTARYGKPIVSCSKGWGGGGEGDVPYGRAKALHGT